MKRSSKNILLLLGLLTVLAIFLIERRVDKRVAYEQYLQELYHSFPKEIDGDDKAIEGQPDQAHFFNFVQTLDPKTKRIPRGGLAKAAQQARLMRQEFRTPTVEGVEGTSPLNWTNIPSNLSGRVRAIAIDPIRAQNDSSSPILWAGSVTGGLWKNMDGDDLSSSWEQVHTGLNQNISISSIVFDPSNPDHIYLGTGESYTAVNIYRESSAVGTGIWKSEDHGVTWNQLPATAQFPYINDIVIREESGKKVIYTAVVSGIYKGGTFNSNPSDGLFRSEDDGATWTQVLPNIPGTSDPYAPSDIELSADGRLFVGTMRNADRLGAGVILYSDNGSDWSVQNDLSEDNFAPHMQYYPGRVIIKAAPSNPDRVYALISGGRLEHTTGWIRDHGSESIIAQSFDAGETWSQFALPDETLGVWSNITWHAAAMAVDPINANTLILSALKGFKMENTQNANMSSSLDWIFISDWLRQIPEKYIHADHHQILFDPNNPEKLYFSTDGGVFLSSNAQVEKPDFIKFNNNLNTLQYYTLDIAQQSGSDLLLAGTQDNNTLKYLGTTIDDHSRVIGGDGAFCFIDEDDPNIQLASSQWNNFVVSFDGMQTGVWITGRGIGTFINPADYDSKNNMLFTNKIGFSVVNNVPNSSPLLRVKLIGAALEEEFMNLGIPLLTPISNIKVSPFATTGKTNLFFGTQSGRLFRVGDAHSNNPFTEEITGSNFPTSNISSIDIGASNNEILVTFSNYGVESVWYTRDGGANWESIEGNLPDMPVRWGIFNPIDKNQVFLATELGVWSSELLEGPTWTQEVNGMSDVRVDMIKARWSDGWMVAASHGRGLFETYLEDAGVVTSLPELPSDQVSVFPNPVIDELTVQFQQALTNKANLKLVNLDGREFIKTETSDQKFSIDVSTLPRGMYLLQINTGKHRPYTKKVLLQ